jgi:homospermidine synthase
VLEKRLRMEPKDITVIDFVDRRRVLRPWTKRGLRFVRERATPLSVSLPLRDFLVPVRSRR